MSIDDRSTSDMSLSEVLPGAFFPEEQPTRRRGAARAQRKRKKKKRRRSFVVLLLTLVIVGGGVAISIGSYLAGVQKVFSTTSVLLAALALTVLAALIWRMPKGAPGFVKDAAASMLIIGYVPMLGAFAALSLLGLNYWIAIVLVPLAVGLVGILIERGLLRRLRGLDQRRHVGAAPRDQHGDAAPRAHSPSSP